LEDAVSVESILKSKGTEVTTIAADASVKRAADWLRSKNIGALMLAAALRYNRYNGYFTHSHH
jgi:hypothetical protein